MTMKKSKSRSTRAGTGAAAVADDYLDLVRRFPLRPLRSREDYDAALVVLRALLGRGEKQSLAAGESDYADVLLRLVRDYDERHSAVLAEAKKLTPIDALKTLMDEHGMNTVSLGKIVGGSGQASLILNGKRELSKANIRALAARFKVSPALFL
jgi:HTH-type transcriptional regulator / antitoxin HigA